MGKKKSNRTAVSAELPAAEQLLAAESARCANQVLETSLRLMAVLGSLETFAAATAEQALRALSRIADGQYGPAELAELSRRSTVLAEYNQETITFGRLVTSKCQRASEQARATLELAGTRLKELEQSPVLASDWSARMRDSISAMKELADANESLIGQATVAAEGFLDHAREVDALLQLSQD